MPSYGTGNYGTGNTTRGTSANYVIIDEVGKGPVAQASVPNSANAREPELICPLCSRMVPASEAIWRKHVARGTTVRFQACPDCRDRSLCPANYHGLHSEVEEDMEPGNEDRGYCSVCRQEFRWTDHGWKDVAPPPIAADIDALNARLQCGDIDLDAYVEALRGITGVEGNGNPADAEGNETKE